MTYGKDNVITKETNKTIRSNALRTFISGLNDSISESPLVKSTGLAQCFGKGPEIGINQFRRSVCTLPVLWF